MRGKKRYNKLRYAESLVGKPFRMSDVKYFLSRGYTGDEAFISAVRKYKSKKTIKH